MAAALVHSPPLLILDEPTVGVDPLLRQGIWQHLVTLTQTERISVIITTHYIEEARQANVVGLMRHGKILAEDSPDELMRQHERDNLEDVFLKLCVTDSSRRAAALAEMSRPLQRTTADTRGSAHDDPAREPYGHRWNSLRRRAHDQEEDSSFTHNATGSKQIDKRAAKTIYTTKPGNNLSSELVAIQPRQKAMPSMIRRGGDGGDGGDGNGTSRIRIEQKSAAYSNQMVENFSSEDDFDTSETSRSSSIITPTTKSPSSESADRTNFRQLIEGAALSDLRQSDDYLAIQAMKWASRRSMLMNDGYQTMLHQQHQRSAAANRGSRGQLTTTVAAQRRHDDEQANKLGQWWKTLMAVTWKNYVRLRRNPPVLVFQFMLPAIQVILFCLCIGGEPFDVPVAVVNDELVPRSSRRFLEGLNKRIIRQVKYDNLTSAMEAVRRGTVWGAIHIPDKYSQNLQSRLIMGEEVTKDTISNGTIRVYPDLTSKYPRHLLI